MGLSDDSPILYQKEWSFQMKTDTIAAIATAMTGGGIGIIRVSGNDAIPIVEQIFQMKSGKRLSEAESHTVHYGYICDNGEVMDEVMVILMRAPKSYTREDVVEVDCHGGIYVLKRILEVIVAHGARPADPGEFTKRAFLNGRIDLSQAESVIDLIQAKNEFALKSSLQQLSGSISYTIRDLRAEILHGIAFIESALDDPEHISLDGFSATLREDVERERKKICHLLENSENGRILKEGISTIIVGKPNVGKSSFLNTLLSEERAIVTNIPGTTRDILEEQLNLNGILLNIVDTAGIRETEDVVERIGVDKAKTFLKDADLVLYIVDTSTELDENDMEIMKLLSGKRAVILLNKSDLAVCVKSKDILRCLSKVGHDKQDYPMISISAKNGSGIAEFEDVVKDMFMSGEITFNDEVYITNVRHKAALMEADSSLGLVLQSIEAGMPEDFYSIDLMNAYESLGVIIGEAVEDDLINEIFSKFCMGK